MEEGKEIPQSRIPDLAVDVSTDPSDNTLKVFIFNRTKNGDIFKRMITYERSGRNFDTGDIAIFPAELDKIKFDWENHTVEHVKELPDTPPASE